MTQSEIFAARLKNARIMKGFSQDDLVSAMGIEISKMSISKYENNKMSPSSSVIISLANALNQPIDYFFRPFTLQIESIKFRKKSRLSVNPEKMIKEKILDLIERYIDIEEICNVSNIFSSPLKDKISNKSFPPDTFTNTLLSVFDKSSGPTSGLNKTMFLNFFASIVNFLSIFNYCFAVNLLFYTIFF